MGTHSSLTSTPSKSPERISGMFNRIAKTYDLLNDCMTMGLHRQWKQQACRQLHLKPGDMVLDVCTGTGDLAHILSSLVGSSGQVKAIDFSEEMLDVARMRFTDLNNIEWLQGDAMTLPFEDNTFHASIISFGLRNVASVPQVLKEMVRVTRPGGCILNLDTASDCNNPLFWLYFSKIMPLFGKLIAKDEQAYQYLCRSTQAFETPSELHQHLLELGLTATRVGYFSFGSVSFQMGKKPELS